LVVEPIKVTLVLLDQLWLERTVTIPGNRDGHIALLRTERFPRLAVAAILLLCGRLIALRVAEVVVELAVQRAAHQRRRQLLEQPVRARQRLRAAPQGQKLVQ